VRPPAERDILSVSYECECGETIHFSIISATSEVAAATSRVAPIWQMRRCDTGIRREAAAPAGRGRLIGKRAGFEL